LSKDQITNRDVDKWGFYEKFDMSLDECFEIFSLAWSNWRELKPMEPHLAQKTKMLQNLVEVDVVTAVQPEHLDDVRQWLEWNKISYRHLVHSHTKHELDYDIYIDDATRNIQAVCDSGKIGLLMNQPWNRDMNDNYDPKGTGGIRRVYNMYHAIDVVRELT